LLSSPHRCFSDLSRHTRGCFRQRLFTRRCPRRANSVLWLRRAASCRSDDERGSRTERHFLNLITGEWIVGEGDGPAAQTARAAAMVSGDASSASRSNSRVSHKDFRPNHTQPFFGKMLFQLR
jgi:hypothetical protein